jgi:thioredoxin 2
MNATSIDNKGVIEVCPTCGKRNRVQFSSLGNTVRCGGCKTELPRLDSPIEIAEESDFESLIGSSSLPVLVDFWADWCGPCKMMAPEVNRVASTHSEKFIIAKVNTEGLPMLAQRFQINALPTLVLFAGHKEVARTQGAQHAMQIQRFVEQTIRPA